MQPYLTPEQSLELHCDLTRHSYRQLSSCDEWDFQLWGSSRGESPDFFEELSSDGRLTVRLQEGGDLGEKMANALQDVLKHYRYAVIVGSDCPALNRGNIKELVDALDKGAQAAIIPATDGGYVALALSEFSMEIFQGVSWGSDQVLAQSLERLAQIQWSVYRAAPLADIDRPEDLPLLDSYEWGKKWSALTP